MMQGRLRECLWIQGWLRTNSYYRTEGGNVPPRQTERLTMIRFREMQAIFWNVRDWAMPASGQPCTPLALIYSDAALTQALPNPTTTDGLGNYFFYAAPGKYEIEISGQGITTKQIPNVILPNDPASPAFSGINWQNWPYSDVSASANS